MSLLCLLRAIYGDVRGTALIEGAIALPVLFILFFGVFEFSWYFYQQHRVTIGIHDAARYIARSDNLLTNLTDVEANAKNLATTGDTSGAGRLRVAGWTASDVQIQFIPNTLPCPSTAYCVVEVSTSFAPLNFGLLGFPFNITVNHYERIVANGS